MTEDVIEADGIRKFSAADIQQQIDYAVATLQDDEHAAVCAFVTPAGEVKLAAVARVGGAWSVMGELARRPGQKVTGRAAVRWSR